VKVWGGSPSTGGFAATRASKTPNRTSLGTGLEAQTAWAFGIILASSSAPEESRVTTSFVLPAFIGSEQVTTTLPDRSPALFNTSSKWRTGRAPHGSARPRWGTARSCATYAFSRSPLSGAFRPFIRPISNGRKGSI